MSSTLQDICKSKTQNNFELEKELYFYNILIDYEYSYERVIKRIRKNVNFPYLKNNKSFERWFRKFINENLDKMKFDNKIDVMLIFAKNIEYKILTFKKIFGVVEDVLYDVQDLIYILNRFLE